MDSKLLQKIKNNLSKAKSIDEYWLIIKDYCDKNNISGFSYNKAFQLAKKIAETGIYAIDGPVYEDWMEDDPEEYFKYQVKSKLAEYGIPENGIVSTMTISEVIADLGDAMEIDEFFDDYEIIAEDEIDEIINNGNSNSEVLQDGEYLAENVWDYLKSMGYDEYDNVLISDLTDAINVSNIEKEFTRTIAKYLIENYHVAFLKPENVIPGATGPGDYAAIPDEF